MMIDKDKIWQLYYGHSYSKNKDSSGTWIDFSEYDNQNSLYGWQVDHIFPKSKLKKAGVAEEFIDDPINLRPMQWENNISKGDAYPSFQINIVADGLNNIRFPQSRKIIDSYQATLRNFYLSNCNVDIDTL